MTELVARVLSIAKTYQAQKKYYLWSLQMIFDDLAAKGVDYHYGIKNLDPIDLCRDTILLNRVPKRLYHEVVVPSLRSVSKQGHRAVMPVRYEVHDDDDTRTFVFKTKLDWDSVTAEIKRVHEEYGRY